MAILHVKTPNGTTKTVDLETMNITSSLQQNGWCKLPNGLIIQWFEASGTRDSNNTTWVPISKTFPVNFVKINPTHLSTVKTTINGGARSPVVRCWGGSKTKFNGGLDSGGLDLVFDTDTKYVYIIAVGA